MSSLTSASFHVLQKAPWSSELFTRCVIDGMHPSIISCSLLVGMGSSAHVFGFMFCIVFSSWLLEIGVNFSNLVVPSCLGR